MKPLLCRLLGHNWVRKEQDPMKFPGYVATYEYTIPFCARCGEPNPNHNQLRK